MFCLLLKDFKSFWLFRFSSSEGFLTGASDLLDEPFMAYNSGSSLVGADLTENFMSFNELN